MLKLGINTVLYKAYDVKTALKAVKLAGYDGAEISAIQGMCEHLVLDAWETQAPLVKAAAKEAGVELLSMEVASLDEDRLTKAFQAAQYLGIPVVNVGPGGKSDDEESFKTSIETLKARSALAAKFGVKLCCKAHVGSSVYSTPTTLKMMELIPDGILRSGRRLFRSARCTKDLRYLPGFEQKTEAAALFRIHLRRIRASGCAGSFLPSR